MPNHEAQDQDLDALVFAEELEERLETCICITFECNGKGPFDGCEYCVGWGCGDLLAT